MTGEIYILSKEVFEEVNGMSNHYWGWGLEDEEFETNIKNHGFHIDRPILITESTEDTFVLTKSERPLTDVMKCNRTFNLAIDEGTVRRDNDGLNATKYRILSTNEHLIEDVTVTVMNIDIECDKEITPWCDCRIETN